MKLFPKILLFSVLISTYLVAQNSIIINEILASNINTFRDEHKDYDDWIELHNASTEAIDVAGMFLSDDPDNPQKWQIPSGFSETILYPDSFLIFWADSEPIEGVLHLGFKLSSTGEDVLLTDTDGTTIVDQVTFPAQTANYSFGRSSLDGTLKYFQHPTPGQINGHGYAGITVSPQLSVEAGNYPGNVDVSLTSDDSTIAYTLDGSLPKTTSELFSNSVNLPGSSVFSARAFKENHIPSIPAAKTYFISENFNLPVLSVITDPANLFSDSIGIYPNYIKGSAAWERPVDMDYIKSGNAEFSIRSGIRIQGRTSRVLPKKSFRIFFKTGYSMDRLNYDMFDLPTVQSFKNLVLRAGYDDDISPANSKGTLLRDPLTSGLWQKTGGLTASGNFAILYLNNDYWGIYNIRESINEYFIEDHLGLADFDLIRYDKKGPLLQWGTFDEWNAMWDFFENSDFTSDSVYQKATTMIDIENFTSLQALVQCTEYRSWLWGVFAFKEKDAAGRWRWAIWDMDRTFTDKTWENVAFYQSTVNERWGNLMMKKLLENESYKIKFINRVSDFFNELCRSDSVFTMIDSLAGLISDEIPNEAVRWNSSVSKWNDNLDHLRDFATDRPDIVRNHIKDHFGLDAAKTITVTQDENKGSLKINSINVDQFSWSGKYFPGIPIQVTAIAKPGFEFAGWSNSELEQNSSITVDPADISTLEPIFINAFESDYYEIIAPAVVKTNDLVPVIFRVRSVNKEINALVSDSLTFLHGDAFADSSFKLKKGTGIFFGENSSESDFQLYINREGFESESKNIKVDNTLEQVHYSGSISGEMIVWDNQVEHIIDDDLNITGGSTLLIKSGTRVKVKRHVNIAVAGTLLIEGNKNYPVVFSSYNPGESWGGIEFYNSDSRIEYSFFLEGGGDPTKGWAHMNIQPTLFAKENSSVTMDNVYILKSIGKAVGSIYSNFTMQNSVTSRALHGGEFHHSKVHINKCYLIDIPDDLSGPPSSDFDNDGFHIDYGATDGSYSLIENSFFIDGKDDAIDHNRGNLMIKNCWIEGWVHEGVAASGKDTVRIFNTVSLRNFNGFEAGNGSPQVFVDHSVAINNVHGLRFGDSYHTPNTGHITATNSIFYNNSNLNIRNYTKAEQGPYEGGIDVSYSMTNDTLYDDLPGNITGVPLFDEYYFLKPQSPGTSAGIGGSDMGLVDELSLKSSSVIINEIMYKASLTYETEDWIELYNPSSNAKNISGWVLKDDKDDTPFTIPQNTIIGANGYLVFCRDTTVFKLQHPDVTNIVGNLPFGLGKDGDIVRLFSSSGIAIDHVEFGISAPWPSAPRGNGPSLELTSPFKDNALADYWIASQIVKGTPGSQNTVFTSIKKNPKVVSEYELFQNYPNPFNPVTNIKFNLVEPAKVSLTIYNIRGQRVIKILKNFPKSSGSHKMEIDLSGYASGVYFYQLIMNVKEKRPIVQTKKMILLK
ncbi:MAG: T9SS C-terminal target domain-containing protein [Calditrichaeota bacterium]|nr:MAG: T9SS C-terminal target domain-containing protein [Calditrichota bacterium]MBL1206431.1 T9SS C-terminal target domain-containing protein [Calditrichota bacterium]NOG46258.1 T9SS type A sorting domain-containing protein [Calditrichota bacterium]